MGIEQSRFYELPEDIDEKLNEFKELWKDKTYQCESFNMIDKEESYLSKDILTKAGNLIASYMKKNQITDLKILEIMAGTGIASKYMKDGLIKNLQEDSNVYWKATELQNISDFVNDDGNIQFEFELDSHEAVVKYDKDYDTLLMISPPPGRFYGDYFAIKEWTKLSNSKYIVFVGELGASDGSEGMYKYMMENPIWKCKFSPMLHEGVDIYGGPIEKQLFIFAKD